MPAIDSFSLTIYPVMSMLKQDNECFEYQDASEPDLPDERGVDGDAALQASLTLPICHGVLGLEKVENTNAVTASRFAPENELRGTVIVCSTPERLVTEYHRLVYDVAEQDDRVWTSRVKDPPAAPLAVKDTA
jgi:hypothetical protein